MSCTQALGFFLSFNLCKQESARCRNKQEKTLGSDPTVRSVLSLPHTHADHPKHVNYVFNQDVGNNVPKAFSGSQCSASVPLVGNTAPAQHYGLQPYCDFKLVTFLYLALLLPTSLAGLREITLLQAKCACDKLPPRPPGTT